MEGKKWRVVACGDYRGKQTQKYCRDRDSTDSKKRYLCCNDGDATRKRYEHKRSFVVEKIKNG